MMTYVAVQHDCVFKLFFNVMFLSGAQFMMSQGLLIFVWVQQHSNKLAKYAQGYLSL